MATQRLRTHDTGPGRTEGSMSYADFSTRETSLVEDDFRQYPDVGEQTVLQAVRTWCHPRCDAVRKRQNWRDVLSDAGLTANGLIRFDMMMQTLLQASCRPLDMRCRCATDLANDEAALLQVIAHLQSTCSSIATEVLDGWLSSPAAGNALKFIRWFAIALLDAGIEINARARRVSYVH
jgi:hypothetical protein